MRWRSRTAAITVMLLAIFLLTPARIAQASEINNSNKLTIQQALDKAYNNNTDLRKAGLSIEKAEIQRDDASEQVTWIPSGGLVSPSYQQVMNGYQQAVIGYDVAKKTEKAETDRITKEIVSAYSSALKNQNNMQDTYLSLQEMKEQKRITSLMMSVGLMSEYDYDALLVGIRQLEEGYKATKAQYDSSIASLRALLGESGTWDPQLDSQPVLDEYQRNELSIELSRGTSESILVYTKKALLDIEQSKENWILPNVSSDMQNINSGMAEIDYQQAKRSAQATIEQLYFSIDAMEGQISSAQTSYNQAVKEATVAKLKYDLGLIPKISSAPGVISLSAATLKVEQAENKLENNRADLANLKAQFAYLTGQATYDENDWKSGE